MLHLIQVLMTAANASVAVPACPMPCRVEYKPQCPKSCRTLSQILNSTAASLDGLSPTDIADVVRKT
ncbi:hypothetical protein ECANGB1_2751, partial [Enterospora canceri]